MLSMTIRLINRTVGRWMLGRADQVVFISDAVRRYFDGFVRFDRPPLHVPNGVDTMTFRPSSSDERAQVREALGVAEADRVVLYVGRFVDKKGLPLLGRLARALPQYRWWFAGWGESGPAHPATWGLPQVRVFGDRSGGTLAELYNAADLLVLASLSEGFPLVVQEAMACGTPVLIASAIADGAPEARALLRLASIDHPDSAVTTWTAAIASAIAGNDGRARAAELSDFARARWSWPATVARYEAIFAAVIAHRR